MWNSVTKLSVIYRCVCTNLSDKILFICQPMTYNDCRVYRHMGRRRKDGEYQQAHVIGTTAVRNNSLNKLVLLHNAVAEIWSSNRQGSKLFKELVERRRKDCPDCVKYEYQEPAYLICHYLNSDDVMKVLGCNRRTALEYLQVLREIVRCYKRF